MASFRTDLIYEYYYCPAKDDCRSWVKILRQGAAAWNAWRASAENDYFRNRPVDLVRADLRGADLHNVNLGGANLTGANLRGVDLSDSDFDGTNLRDADLDGANLTGANFFSQTKIKISDSKTGSSGKAILILIAIILLIAFLS